MRDGLMARQNRGALPVYSAKRTERTRRREKLGIEKRWRLKQEGATTVMTTMERISNIARI